MWKYRFKLEMPGFISKSKKNIHLSNIYSYSKRDYTWIPSNLPSYLNIIEIVHPQLLFRLEITMCMHLKCLENNLLLLNYSIFIFLYHPLALFFSPYLLLSCSPFCTILYNFSAKYFYFKWNSMLCNVCNSCIEIEICIVGIKKEAKFTRKIGKEISNYGNDYAKCGTRSGFERKKHTVNSQFWSNWKSIQGNINEKKEKRNEKKTEKNYFLKNLLRVDMKRTCWENLISIR